MENKVIFFFKDGSILERPLCSSVKSPNGERPVSYRIEFDNEFIATSAGFMKFVTYLRIYESMIERKEDAVK